MITKKFLEQALVNLPKKHSLRYAETYIKNALSEIDKYEKGNTAKKSSPADAWKNQIAASAIQAAVATAKEPLARESTLSILDRMIQDEKDRLTQQKQQQEEDELPPTVMSD